MKDMKEKKHIIFLQVAHTTHDERVFFHQAKSLQEVGHIVEIYGIESSHTFTPKPADIYIVDTPMAMWKIRNLSTKIIYDITEWYPSKKNLRNMRWGKLTKIFILTLANIWAGWKASAFIFGENDKAKPFQFLFRKKTHIFLPYYPNLAYITPTPATDIHEKCHLLYAGPLTEEKGWNRVLETMHAIAREFPHTHFQLDVITQSTLTHAHTIKNLHIQKLDFMPFEIFCQQITNYDIFLDLRNIDFENTRCLPIKLFYYMACGRPSIYSNLSAINHGIPEVNQCTKLVNNVDEAIVALKEYIGNNTLYQQHCSNARSLAEHKYNWNKISTRFIQLISQL